MEEGLYERIYEVIRQIPRGRVATYGQIAALVGPPCGGRTVGYALAALGRRLDGPPVPWQRVINAQGKVSTGPNQQRLLEEEGVVFDEAGRTDLQRFGWPGPDPAWAAAHGCGAPPPAEPPGAESPQLRLF
ncbi:MAG: 6-O-methylguanine DNA methyltransferase [Chloroflexi bacterium]|nr:6-O-methylguanine DNA methyltransferase [Chloroflexota bacterium]